MINKGLDYNQHELDLFSKLVELGNLDCQGLVNWLLC